MQEQQLPPFIVRLLPHERKEFDTLFITLLTAYFKGHVIKKEKLINQIYSAAKTYMLNPYNKSRLQPSEMSRQINILWKAVHYYAYPFDVKDIWEIAVREASLFLINSTPRNNVIWTKANVLQIGSSHQVANWVDPAGYPFELSGDLCIFYDDNLRHQVIHVPLQRKKIWPYSKMIDSEGNVHQLYHEMSDQEYSNLTYHTVIKG